MIKDIRFNGFSVQPSDYECADGSLAASLNLISEDGYIRPIQASKELCQLPYDNCQHLFFHKVNTQVNLLFLHEGNLYWTRYSNLEGSDVITGSITSDDCTLIGSFPNLVDAKPIGNIISIAYGNAAPISFLRWMDGNYLSLPSRPPLVQIEFGLTEMGAGEQLSQTNISFQHPQYFRDQNRPSEMEAAARPFSNAVMGAILKAINEQTKVGYFLNPFFIRYAYRLYDGSHAYFSNPVLMIPNAMMPRCEVSSVVLNQNPPYGDDGWVSGQLRVGYYCCRLDSRIIHVGSDLALWNEVITGIDIFVSAPIYTFDQSEDFSYELFPLSSLDIGAEEVSDSSDETASDEGNSRYGSGSGSSGTTRPTTPSFDDGSVSSGNDGSFFMGRFRDSILGDYDFKNRYGDSAAHKYIKLQRNKRFHALIKDTSNFYKIASIKFEHIKTEETFSTLHLDASDLNTIYAREPLKSDYPSSYDIFGNYLFPYNNRLDVAVSALRSPQPLPLSMSISATAADDPAVDIRTTIYTRINGELSCVQSTSQVNFNCETDFPRYLFYPDSNAFLLKLEYKTTDSENYTLWAILPLVTHDFLNGAYWYGGATVYDPRPLRDATIPDNASDLNANIPIEAPSRLYLSEINNPFVFPNSLVTTVGQGTILGLSSAAKALSQGQFGQFPLYAFTTEGVWALEVSSTGSYSARQPITRDVCINPGSITQLDSSVLFVTDRGIMLLSGSQAQCVSDSINTETPFNLLSLPSMSRLHEMIHQDPDSCLPIQPFSQFMHKSGMLYDYTHQRVILYNKDFSYAYVYSLKSQLWGMIHSSVKFSLNSYPSAVALSRQRTLIDFSSPSVSATEGLLLTRPLKLGDGGSLKTLRTAVARGVMERGHVGMVVYGSMDLKRWHVIGSAKGDRVRGISGTPYRYFRVALVTSLGEDESLSGLTVEYEPRLTGRI